MSKKSTPLPSLKRHSTRSISTPKSTIEKDKYTFESDDEDHQSKPVLIRKSNLISKRPRGRPPKTPVSSSNSESEEKKSSDNIRDKIKINSTPPILITPKKRGRKPKMLSNEQQHPQPKNENLNPSSPSTNKQRPTDADEFSDDSVDFVWKGSSKMSIEILKRRIPKDESRDYSSIQSDPTAQRKRAIIPRLTNFDNLSGQPIESSSTTNDERTLKKPTSSIITMNNAFQNDFDYSYNDKGTKMTTTTANTDDKPRPRVYAVKSTTMKSRSQQDSSSDVKRTKWLAEIDDDEQHLQTSTDEPADYDYAPKGNYMSKQRSNYRGRGSFPGRRGRPPGSRRHWNNDDDDDDYDQYEDTNARYGSRKQHSNYRTNRSMYDTADDDEYDKTRRMSLTQAYRRPNDIRQPTMNRRIGLNNGNHSAYKNDNYYHQQSRPTTNASTINSGNTFVAKINDAQLSEVANQSQIFFVNMPQQDQKNQQVLSVLASEQQQVLPVAVVQQAKVETPVNSSTNNSSGQNQTLAFTVKLPVDTPKQKKILPKPSANASQSANNSNLSSTTSKPFAWSRPPGRIQLNNDEQTTGKGLTITPINTDLDTMEAAHVLATAADVTMANDARRKAQQHDDEMSMMVDETPSNIVNEETVQCEDDGQKTLGTITANIIDENGLEHTVILSTEDAQQLLGSQGAIIVDGDGQPIPLQQAQTQTFLSPFALDQAQLQALLAQAGIDPNTPLTIEQIDPNQQQQVATLCTSPGGTQYTVLTQAPAQQQFILQTTTESAIAAPAPPPPPQLIAPKEDLSSPPKRRAFAVKSTLPTSETYDDINDRPRRKIFATKSTVSSIE